MASFRAIAPGAYQFFYADTNLSPMPSWLGIEPLDPAWLVTGPDPAVASDGGVAQPVGETAVRHCDPQGRIVIGCVEEADAGGGPVYPGDDEAVIPLPYPGEGGPVYPGDDEPAGVR